MKKKKKTRQNMSSAICRKNIKRVLILLFAPVYCNVLREALPVDGTTTVFYVFGSEAIYIVEPENKTVLTTIEAGDLCTLGR